MPSRLLGAGYQETPRNKRMLFFSVFTDEPGYRKLIFKSIFNPTPNFSSCKKKVTPTVVSTRMKIYRLLANYNKYQISTENSFLRTTLQATYAIKRLLVKSVGVTEAWPKQSGRAANFCNSSTLSVR